MFAKGVQVKAAIAANAGKAPDEAQKIGLALMNPGGFVKDPISAISFGMALMFGTAGLPHILMRFFTVPDAKAGAQERCSGPPPGSATSMC